MKRLSLSISALALFATSGFAQQDSSPGLLGLLTKTLAKTEEPATQLNVLRGMNAALKGKRDVAAPAEWSDVYEKLKTSPDQEVRQQAQALAAIFGGGSALAELRKTLVDAKAPVEARQRAIRSGRLQV